MANEFEESAGRFGDPKVAATANEKVIDKRGSSGKSAHMNITVPKDVLDAYRAICRRDGTTVSHEIQVMMAAVVSDPDNAAWVAKYGKVMADKPRKRVCFFRGGARRPRERDFELP